MREYRRHRVRQLHPVVSDEVDLTRLYAAGRQARPDRPWVALTMIATVDGAVSIDGVSGPLGGPGDRVVFRALRALADLVLVGAGTVRAENYGPAAVRLAIVSRRLHLEPAARVFSGTGERPLVITSEHADPARRAALDDVAEVVSVGAAEVDLTAALAVLGGRGARTVLCEGGPSLNGQLLAHALVDELCLTVAPMLASGASSRLAHGEAPPVPTVLELAHVLEEDGYLFLRYFVP